MRGRLITVGIVIALIAIALLGYVQVTTYLDHRHKSEQAFDDTKKAVGKTTAATEHFLQLELAPDSAITYADLFQQIGDRTKVIDSDIIDIQASDADQSVKAAAVAYVASAENVIRLQEQKYHKALALTSAINAATSALEDYKAAPYNEYTNRYDLQRAKKSVDEMNTSNGEAGDAKVAFYKGLISFRTAIETNAGALTQFPLVDKSVLGKVIAKSKPEVKGTK